MTGFEPGSSGIVSDPFANRATTTSPLFIFIEQLFIKTLFETFRTKWGLERYLATSKSVQEARNTFRHSHSHQQQL